MDNLKALNSREKKEICSLIKKQFDAELDDYVLFMNSKNRVFLISNDLSKIHVDKLRVNSLGLYLGEVYENSIRLSIEGTQLIGKSAKKNVLEINDEEAVMWMRGEDFSVDTDMEGFVIVKNSEDYLGCGKVSGKKLFNYVPKERRVLVNVSHTKLREEDSPDYSL